MHDNMPTTPADFLDCIEDQKLYAVLSSYLDSYDGAPLMAWQRADLATREFNCGDYATGGVQVEETSPYSTTVEAHAEGWVEL